MAATPRVQLPELQFVMADGLAAVRQCAAFFPLRHFVTASRFVPRRNPAVGTWSAVVGSISVRPSRKNPNRFSFRAQNVAFTVVGRRGIWSFRDTRFSVYDLVTIFRLDTLLFQQTRFVQHAFKDRHPNVILHERTISPPFTYISTYARSLGRVLTARKMRERTVGAYMCIDVHPTGTQRWPGHRSDYLSRATVRGFVRPRLELKMYERVLHTSFIRDPNVLEVSEKNYILSLFSFL